MTAAGCSEACRRCPFSNAKKRISLPIKIKVFSPACGKHSAGERHLKNPLQKTKHLLLTFATSTEAYAMEEACQRHALRGRLIPVPRAIAATCGLSFAAPLTEKDKIKTLLASEDIHPEAEYELDL